MLRILVVFGVAISVSFGGSLRAAEEFKTDAEGYIRNWLILAPIAFAEGSFAGADELDKKLIDEAAAKPKAGDKAKVGGRDMEWKKITAADYYFDINANIAERQEQGTAYAIAYVVADQDFKGLKAKFSSNDQGKLIVNGKEIHSFAETRSIDKDQDEVALSLNKGVNVILHKVINESNDWQGALRFVDKDGKAVTGLKIRLEP